MEYPLTLKNYGNNYQKYCLNPCSNGIPSDTRRKLRSKRPQKVLIPVLMEYPLTYCWNKRGQNL